MWTTRRFQGGGNTRGPRRLKSEGTNIEITIKSTIPTHETHTTTLYIHFGHLLTMSN